MGYSYLEHLGAFPFLICATGLGYNEMEMVFGPEHLVQSSGEVGSTFYRLAKGHVCPVVSVAFWQRKTLFLGNVVFSDLRDFRTGRKGIYLIYGGALSPKACLRFRNVGATLFSELEEFLRIQFGADMTVAGIDRVILAFQQEVASETLFERTIVTNFFRRIESQLYCGKKPTGRLDSWLDFVRIRKLLRRQRLQPFVEIQNTNKFWKEIDEALSKVSGVVVNQVQ